MSNSYIPLFFILGGIFGMLGAYFQWNFFFAHRKAQWMVKTIGIRGARIFYFVVGLIVFAMGWGFLLGYIPLQK